MRSPRERTGSGSTAGTAATTALTLALILLVVGSLLWFGWLEWPGLHWDADLFASALMNVALKDSWTFDSYSQFRISKPTNAYDFHGVLQVWFYAKLLHVRNWQQLTLAMAALNSLTYLVWVWLYQRSLHRWARPAPWLKAACLALVPALLLLGLQGRPEQLAPLLLAMPVLVRELHGPAALRRSCDGLTLAALFLLSPLVGLMASAGFCLWFAAESRRPWRSRAVELGLVLGLAAGASVLGLALISPLNPLTWLQNLRTGGTTVPFGWVIRNAETWRWGTTLVAPFWSAVLGAALLIVLLRWLRRRQVLVLIPSIAALMWVVQRGLDYSYTPFLPLVTLLWIDRRLLVPPQLRWRRLSLEVLPLLWASAYGLMLAQRLAYSFTVLRDGGTPAQARSLLAGLRDPRLPASRQTIATAMAQEHAGLVLAPAETPSIAVPWSRTATAEPWPFWSLHRFEAKAQRQVAFFVLQQSHQGVYIPPPQTIYLDRDQPFVLIKDGWKRDYTFWQRRLLPARLGNGFWLAIYKRVEPSPQQPARGQEGERRTHHNHQQTR